MPYELELFIKSPKYDIENLFWQYIGNNGKHGKKILNCDSKGNRMNPFFSNIFIIAISIFAFA
jgi:hypothetical protein